MRKAAGPQNANDRKRAATSEPGDAIDSDTLSRFRRDLEAITTRPPDALSPLGIAVSGGGDSLGLLLLAAAAYPGHVTAVTVDHRLRAEAADEAHCRMEAANVTAAPSVSTVKQVLKVGLKELLSGADVGVSPNVSLNSDVVCTFGR